MFFRVSEYFGSGRCVSTNHTDLHFFADPTYVQSRRAEANIICVQNEKKKKKKKKKKKIHE